MDDVEFRYFEVRSDARERTLRGTVVRYGDRADIAQTFTEEVRAGAFHIGEGLILNHQHDRSKPLVRLGEGLEIRDDTGSCSFRAVMPNTSVANAAFELVEAGLLRGVSAEFRVKRDEWCSTRSHRVILDADLLGLALVDRPAYPASSVSLRNSVWCRGHGSRRVLY